MNEELLGLLGATPEQIAQARQRSGLEELGLLGQALMQAGAPAPRGTSTLGRLGQAAGMYTQAPRQTMDTLLQDLLRKQQIQDMQKKREQQLQSEAARQQFANMFAPTTPQTALAAPGRVGPTAARAATIGQMPQISQQDVLRMAMNPDLPPEQREAAFKYVEMMKPPEQKLPTDVQEYNFAVTQGFKGTFLDFQKQLRESGATRITNNLPGGEKKLLETLGAATGKAVEDSYNQAVSARDTLNKIQEIRPLLSGDVYAGPLSQAPRLIDQVATQFGVTSETTKQKLADTAKVMQGLAQFELNAAAAMRGQGAITENERMLIQRAAAGRLDQFTVGEVQELLNALEKTSQYKIEQHNSRLNKVRGSSKNPEISAFTSVFEVTPMSMPLGQPQPSRLRFNPATQRAE
jgi:hypothetical protein